MKCQIVIDESVFSYEIEGDFSYGDDEILFAEHRQNLEKSNFYEEGYTIESIFSEKELSKLKVDTLDNLKKSLRTIYREDYKDLRLDNYHKYINEDLHQKLIKKTRVLSFSDFNLDSTKLKSKIEKILNKKISSNNQLLDREILILRISRPNSLDINPPHRDGYLDVWKNTINLWIPIEGCNNLSSLPLIPKSHFWNEKNIYKTENKGASINGMNYHVPGILSYENNNLEMIRPNPQLGEIIIFTPFLVHGSAINAQTDKTRFSLEVRFPFA